MTTSLAVRTRARVSGGLLCIAVSCLTPPRASAQAAEPVQWTNLVHAAAAGNSIQKVGGCDGCADAGGTSGVAIASGDGYVEFRPRLGGRLYAGLGTTSSASADPALINYAFSFWPDGGWDVREHAEYKAEGRFVAGDVFRVALVGGAHRYLAEWRARLFQPCSSVVAAPPRRDPDQRRRRARRGRPVTGRTSSRCPCR